MDFVVFTPTLQQADNNKTNKVDINDNISKKNIAKIIILA